MVSQRPSKVWMFMEMARASRERSTCSRNQVGCVVTDEGGTSVVSLGYNGNAAGLTNSCDKPHEMGNCGCIHAEVNALIKAPFREGPLTLYTTTAPCEACAKLIINSAVTKVIFLDHYRHTDGLRVLRHAPKGILCWQYDAALDHLITAVV